jgi:hypothetical protein
MKLHEYLAREITRGTRRSYARLEEDYLQEQVYDTERETLKVHPRPKANQPQPANPKHKKQKVWLPTLAANGPRCPVRRPELERLMLRTNYIGRAALLAPRPTKVMLRVN